MKLANREAERHTDRQKKIDIDTETRTYRPTDKQTHRCTIPPTGIHTETDGSIDKKTQCIDIQNH